MRGLARFLEKQGYRVLNLGYPSTRYSLEELSDIIHDTVQPFAESLPGVLHFVGYSMGGLVVRVYLQRHRPENLGRVVMIGTPNHGSEMADFVKNWRIYRWLYGPAGQQLTTDQSGVLAHLGQVNYDLGVVAGNWSLDLLGAYIIGKPNDGKVSVESTRLSGMRDHVIVSTSHAFMVSNRTVWQQILQFLRMGRFLH